MSPNYKVKLGETFVVEAHDCYGGQITSEEVLRPDINLDIMNQATGPIYVEGLSTKDVLIIEIKDIELAQHGIMVTTNGLGILGEQIKEPTTKILKIENGKVTLDDITFPIHPMIGVIGVAPRSGEIHCAVPGDHGGNLDTKDITIGNKLYLPVFKEGGNFALGDIHASMGDGEMNGTGVEIGGKVTLTVSKLAGKQIHSPIVENENYFLFISSASSLEKAIKKCAKVTVNHLEEQLSVSFETAYRLLSAVCDIKISQLVNKLVTVSIAVPKFILPRLFP